MTRSPKTRTPVPADIKAARKLLDELAEARAVMRDLRKDIDALNRRAAKAEREVRALKAAKKPATAPRKRTNG